MHETDYTETCKEKLLPKIEWQMNLKKNLVTHDNIILR
jgi:hypothetical protein